MSNLRQGDVVEVEVKSAFVSKTIIANVLSVLVVSLPAIAGVIPPDIAVYITGILLPIINVVLRFVTDQPVSLKS